ncbi:MAG: hypothetical protein K0B37_17955 [Bacteroidales bacterium]|nr:hypothetical protein [Bacteroidales bacterium]
MKFSKIFQLAGLILVLILLNVNPSASQNLPDVLNEATLDEQYKYLHDETRIYNNFRAIREDMFQKIRRNSIDSLNRAYQKIAAEIQHKEQAVAEKNAMALLLVEMEAERDQAILDRDSLFLLGLPVSKTFYNVLLWSVIGILAVLAFAAFIMFFRSNKITRQKTKDLKELQVEYDEYRKTSRERFEQQSIDHFNELKRLKGI